MRYFILLIFIGVFLTKNVISSKVHKYPSNLAWLFGLNDKSNENKEEDTRTVCQTEECKKIAKVILESMNKSVKPCDDFYEYACGKWPEHNPIPEGRKRWSLFHMVEKNTEQQIQDILKMGLKDNDLLAVKLAKRWYMTCMDTDAMDKQGLEPLVSTLSRIGGWPMVMDPDEWNEQEYSWQKVDDQYARLRGRNAFHDVIIKDIGSNETKNVARITVPHLPPDAFILWALVSPDSDEEIEDHRESDEDPSNEEKHSDEQEDPDPGSEGEDDDDNEIDSNKDTKKKKPTNKFDRKKNKKLKKSDNRITKKHSKTRKQRIKRRVITTKAGNKYLSRRKKLNARKGSKAKKTKTLDDTKATHTSTTPRLTTEETDEVDGVMKRQEYTDYISQVARAIAKVRDMEVPQESIDKDVEDMIDFQIKLTDIVMESGEDLMLTLDDFQEWYDKKESKSTNSKINWIYKITGLFDEANVPVDGDLDTQVPSPEYFEALISLLDETPSRTIVNYIHWNFLSKIIQTTTKEMRSLHDQWEDDDEEEMKMRSSKCIKEVEMSDVLSYEYVRNHFSDDIAKTAMDMMDDIQKEVEYQIKESDWMDDDTKNFVLSKLVNMEKLVGYPDWYRNNTIVKQYFQGLIVGKSYYENKLSYRRYLKWQELRELIEEDDDDDIETWWMNPITVNALFIPYENSITLTAADFQSPLFAYGRPQTLNFGIIGFIMAHEVNHGFDDTGHLYDKDGDFMEWLSSMAEAYSERVECFVDQFDNYSVDKESNKKIKNYGNLTADENIADTMGLQAVFRAYRRRERECEKPDAALPGLEELTNDQLFFLSFANLWCEAIDPSYSMTRAKTDEHSSGRLRVIGSVSNSEDFAKAYNCPIGSAMNPEKKCSIWK